MKARLSNVVCAVLRGLFIPSAKDTEKEHRLDDQAMHRNWWKATRSDDAKHELARDPQAGKDCDATGER